MPECKQCGNGCEDLDDEFCSTRCRKEYEQDEYDAHCDDLYSEKKDERDR